ncbi:hypothetical protein [Marinobacter xestospongiae]|uniref:Cyclodipeptide synthase n=1 Tax=Marinobacter xestospongiae TaxID=994319 RepID=A0ABU3W1E1_9GAMM|nr:hypothetical protein [Marinobacter xestospongiae]MDV2080354.1 hypothetical protein [Marinobacter xestospongiae]
MTLINLKYIKKVIFGLRQHHPEYPEHLSAGIVHLCESNEELCRNVCKLAEYLMENFDVHRCHRNTLIINIFAGLAQGEIRFFSVHSHAINSSQIYKLRDKKQYRDSCDIASDLLSVCDKLKLSMSFTNILADIDRRYLSTEYEPIWEMNLSYLQKESGLKCQRLSEACDSLYQRLYEDIENLPQYIKLKKRIKLFNSSTLTMANFSSTPNFIEQQISSYVIAGLVLEQRIPYGILIDLQNTLFPFEQPFYNFERSSKLPIVYRKKSPKFNKYNAVG